MLPNIGYINITVNNATLADHYAVSTLYETSGYTFEKVKLTTNNGGTTYTGTLPVLNDGTARTVMVFLDIPANPHLFGGTVYPASNPRNGSGNHRACSA